MKDSLFTVEQVAQKLDLHPKTIRRFIREEKLKAKKIGKQWRITDVAIKDFMGQNDTHAVETNPQSEASFFTTDSGGETPRKVQVSAVVDIFVADIEEAVRISNTLFAILNCKDPSYGSARCDHIFYQKDLKARYILWGSPRFIAAILECIEAITGPKN